MSFDYLQHRLNDLLGQHRLRQLVPRQQHGVHIVDPDGRKLLNFGSNDYLGFAGEQRSVSVQPGSAASALVCGWTQQHQQLAEAIADLEGCESAAIFPSGFAACSGSVATLAESGDLILSDELNHASLIDGCRLSRADCVVYPHRDYGFIRDVLAKRRAEFARVWIVTDGVFSMDGHVAPLRELCDIADQHDARLMVDEAHATGVLGSTGGGLCEALGVKQRVAIRIGTLSKAMGAQGGFVAGPKVVTDYLVNRCRSLIYSTSLAPGSVQAAIDAVSAIRSDSSRRHDVGKMSRLIRQRLSIEADEVESGVPIIPIHVGDDAAAVERSQRLYEQGFYVPAIRPPTVPAGTARLRISISAAHDQTMINSLLDALRFAA